MPHLYTKFEDTCTFCFRQWLRFLIIYNFLGISFLGKMFYEIVLCFPPSHIFCQWISSHQTSLTPFFFILSCQGLKILNTRIDVLMVRKLKLKYSVLCFLMFYELILPLLSHSLYINYTFCKLDIKVLLKCNYTY